MQPVPVSEEEEKRKVKRREKNLKRKKRRLEKEAMILKLGRPPTPIPTAEVKINSGTVLNEKNTSIIVDLSNYKPFSIGSSPNEPFLFGSTEREVRSPPLTNSPEVQLRFLNPDDLPDVKRLCQEWFPIEYPESWYVDITSNTKFYAVACVLHGAIIGLVVAEVKDAHQLPKEDSTILAATYGRGTKIGYILSLGVVKEYRQNGIASFLLENLIAHMTSVDNQAVKAIYLHVLTTNSKAISFYEHRGFRPHLFLPFYYAINGKRKDGFIYVLYINGGHPPWSLLDYFSHCCTYICSSLNPFYLARFAFRKFNLAWLLVAPRVRQIAQSSTAVFS